MTHGRGHPVLATYMLTSTKTLGHTGSPPWFPFSSFESG
jgi:hypothetical protein